MSELPNQQRRHSSPVPGSTLTAILLAVVAIAALYFGREVLVPISLAVLLSFVQSSPLLGGAIAGVAASAASAAIAKRSRAIPTMILFMATLSETLVRRKFGGILPRKAQRAIA